MISSAGPRSDRVFCRKPALIKPVSTLASGLAGIGIPDLLSTRFFPQTESSTVRLGGDSTLPFSSIGLPSFTMACTATGLTALVIFIIRTDMVLSHVVDFMVAVFTDQPCPRRGRPKELQ